MLAQGNDLLQFAEAVDIEKDAVSQAECEELGILRAGSLQSRSIETCRQSVHQFSVGGYVNGD